MKLPPQQGDLESGPEYDKVYLPVMLPTLKWLSQLTFDFQTAPQCKRVEKDIYKGVGHCWLMFRINTYMPLTATFVDDYFENIEFVYFTICSFQHST